ncbi:hypothetical protein [Lacinutrix undariae]
MKKITFLILFLSVLSCNNDDDTIVQCNIPNNITTTNISFESAQINWEDTNTNATYTIQYGLSGFNLGNGNTIDVSQTTLQLTSLLANTTYDYYISSVCSVSNTSMYSEVSNFTTLPPPVVAQFLPQLSELNLFAGNISELQPSIYTFQYNLTTPLFTDYAHKQRIISIPNGESMTYNGDGFPEFPNNTVIAKTFYYFINDNDESLGKNKIETRVLIKQNGNWVLGNYKWNDAQTNATLDTEGATVPVTWIDTEGNSNNVSYQIPSSTDCFTCHSNANTVTPIGPKLRTLNLTINGTNQLQALKDLQLLSGLTSPSDVSVLPNWSDTSQPLEQRARAYFDINCAHCHTPGGYCDEESDLDLRFETDYADTNIFERRYLITARTNYYIPAFSMPYIGTTMIHTEGYNLIQSYLDTL